MIKPRLYVGKRNDCWDQLMPGLGPGRPPPRLCPICRERLWFEDRIGLSAAWQYYNVHMHNVHSEFERWNRRMSGNYGIGILFLIGALITTGILRNTPITPLLLGLFLIVSAIVYLIQRTGRKRFRTSWNEEHGAPINPQQ